MPLFNFFGKQETAEEVAKRDKEMLRQWQRNLKGEMRQMERQIRKIQFEEEKVKKDIKTYAKKGEMTAVKTLVKEVCRSKAAVNRMYTSKAQLNSVCMEITQMAATMKLADTMKQSSSIMKQMNQIIKVPEVRENMAEMQREMMKAGLIQETINDTLEDMEPDLEEQADEQVQSVLEELAIENLEGLFPTPAGKMPAAKAKAKAAEPAKPAAAEAEATAAEDDLMARLNAL